MGFYWLLQSHLGFEKADKFQGGSREGVPPNRAWWEREDMFSTGGTSGRPCGWKRDCRVVVKHWVWRVTIYIWQPTNAIFEVLVHWFTPWARACLCACICTCTHAHTIPYWEIVLISWCYSEDSVKWCMEDAAGFLIKMIAVFITNGLRCLAKAKICSNSWTSPSKCICVCNCISLLGLP